MSLNDYFAANGAVYLRPMGLPDCFSMPGLPHGLKPPSLPLQPQQKPRTMAAVSPLHQGLPPPPPPNMGGGGYEGGYGGGQPNNRTSSFAAALRKLAKQAVDPVAGDKDPTQLSPVSSPSLGGQGAPLPPKRSAPANSGVFMSSHQGAYGGSSPPPVVTIAPSRPVATHTSDSRKVVDLSSVPPTNPSNPISNGHMQEPLKMDSSKRHADKWEESTLANKGLSVSSASSQVRPHATIAPLPRPDDSVTSSRGFQPYRGGGGGGGSGEESRPALQPHHPLSMFEHHHPAYPYGPPAFLPQATHLAHPAYRFDDPLYLERYSLLRPPMLQYGQPSMMGPPAFYPNSRYAADLIAQSLSISNNNILNHERLKAEEQERRIREKEQELKEQERQRDRDREHREKEKERRHSKDEHHEHRKGSSSSNSYSLSSSKRTESPSVRTTPVIHSTPNHVSAPTVVSSSSAIPLNLVLQVGEPQRKETTELWMPWQQPANNHAKDANQDMGPKHPAYRTQDGHRHHQTRENHTNDKPPNLRFSPSSTMEKKQTIPTPSDQNIDKKHPDINNLHRPSENTRTHQDNPRTDYRTQQDTQRTDYRTQEASNNNRTSFETSAKDSTPHEWRHEKLQKACTNIHRKSHESKRASNQKEGIYQNHNHSRKTVNGTVLKPTTLYQNEGMHARLLESEKCRLEMNGHVIKSPSSNSGLLVPSPYKSSYPQQLNNKDHGYFGGSSVLLKSSVVELPPVVSKLDIELRRLKKGEKLCVDEEKEERRVRNLLVIAKMPRLKFDSNPHKLDFLRLFGLTTHLKKKKVEFDMFLKRRKRLRQDSCLPPPNSPKEEATRRDEEEDEDPIVDKRTPVEVDRLAERLRAEDNEPEKTEFLSLIGLKPFTLELREEKARLRRKVSEEKCRRHYRLLATVNRKSSPKRLFVPKSEAAQRLDHLKKLNEMNAVPNGLICKGTDEDEEVKPSSTQTPKMEQVPYPLSVESCPAPNKSLAKYSFKRGHSLKREFGFATPHATHKSLRAGGLTNGVASASATSLRRSVGTQADAAAEKCAAELKSSLGLSATIETLMEVIYKSQTEQSGEKSVLGERCQQLRQTQEDLKQHADALSRKMSDLLRSKRELDEERQGRQKSIDHLKKCLQLGR